MRTVVNLDGGWGDRLDETLAALDRAHPDRFLTFAQINFAGIDDAGLERSRGRSPGGELSARGQGLEDPQIARPGHPLQGRHA